MKVKKIQVKSILVKTNLPSGDFVINPYVGCEHSCVYCYARFMKRFTKHPEPWGSFVDVKINAPEVLQQQLLKFKNSQRIYHVLLSSVTDPYQPLEKKYKLTKKIIEILSKYSCFNVEILTKSDLILRDLKLLKKIRNLSIVFSIGVIDDKIARFIEPKAALPSKRLTALQEIHKNHIKTSVFISPILPFLTDLKDIFEKIKGSTDEVFAETFNPKGKNYECLNKVLKARFPKLISQYNKIFLAQHRNGAGFTNYYQTYLRQTKKEFYSLAKKYQLPVWGFFTH